MKGILKTSHTFKEKALRSSSVDSNNNSNNNNNKSVRFYSFRSSTAAVTTDQFFPVRNRNEFSREEAMDIWLNEDDFLLIRKDIKRSIRLMHDGVPEDDAEFICFRGLERKRWARGAQRKEWREAAYQAVFDAQWEQEEEEWGGINWDHIREAYQPISKEAMGEAHMVGLTDAFIVRLESTKECLSSTLKVKAQAIGHAERTNGQHSTSASICTLSPKKKAVLAIHRNHRGGLRSL